VFAQLFIKYSFSTVSPGFHGYLVITIVVFCSLIPGRKVRFNFGLGTNKKRTWSEQKRHFWTERPQTGKTTTCGQMDQ